MKKIIIALFVALSFGGCKGFNSNQAKIEDNLNDVTQNLKLDIQKKNDTLKYLYNKTNEKFSDTLSVEKVRLYYVQLNQTFKFIDTLKVELDKIKNVDLNKNTVQELFAENGTKLFNDINKCYNLLSTITKEKNLLIEIMKSKENLLNNANYDKLSDFYFGQNEPQQATWILSGFELELLKIGISAFKVY